MGISKGFWMHEKAMDVFLEGLTVLPGGRISGRWWNLGYTGNPWCLDNSPRGVRIAPEDVSKWININDRVTNVRTKSGVPDGI